MKHDATQTIPPEIAELLANTPETTQEMLDELAEANRELQNDPEFIADFERTKFVDSILAAMQERNVKRSELANNLGKSRQYVQKVLNEDARVSFTLKTMVQLCHALGKKLNLEIVDRDNSAVSLSFQKKQRIVSLRNELFENTTRLAVHRINFLPKRSPAAPKYLPKKIDSDDYRLSA